MAKNLVQLDQTSPTNPRGELPAIADQVELLNLVLQELRKIRFVIEAIAQIRGEDLTL